MRLIDADALIREECGSCDGHCETFDGEECLKCTSHNKCQLRQSIDDAPTVEAIPIDTVAEMLADLFGDECACNYNNIDEMLSIGCKKAHCPDDGDHSCWKKYVMHWLKRKMDGGKQDGD